MRIKPPFNHVEQKRVKMPESLVDLSPVARSLNRIYQEISTNGAQEETLKNLGADIKCVEKHFGINAKAAVMLAKICDSDTMGGSDKEDLANFVGCTNIEFTAFQKALTQLRKRGISRRSQRGMADTYRLTREALRSLQVGQEFSPLSLNVSTTKELFKRILSIFSECAEERSESDSVLCELEELFENNPDLPFCKSYCFSDDMKFCASYEKLVFLYICQRYVNFNERQINQMEILEQINWMDGIEEVMHDIDADICSLQAIRLISYGGTNGFLDKETLTLTDRAIKAYLPDIKPPLRFGFNECGGRLVPCSSITPKELFYNATENEHMERLESMLDEQNFKGIKQRLSEMGMRQGFAVLFTGAAGCGKTAGVYELARKTGRDVLAVDMSELKSKWVGDSEKIVKSLFGNYNQICSEKENAPILLFNEADAIFNKRIANPGHSADVMLNTVQNICLEEMENLNGILIATTNLADNFCDEAFSRRFIYKVKFNVPDVATRAKIWKSMIKDLSDADAGYLAKRYNISGGIIENVARKAAVDYVLYGRKAGLNELIKYCDEESAIKASTNVVGFCV